MHPFLRFKYQNEKEGEEESERRKGKKMFGILNGSRYQLHNQSNVEIRVFFLSRIFKNNIFFIDEEERKSLHNA